MSSFTTQSEETQSWEEKRSMNCVLEEQDEREGALCHPSFNEAGFDASLGYMKGMRGVPFTSELT